MLIQTLAAETAERLISIKRESKDLTSSLQEEAAAQGELSAYEYLLYLSQTEPPMAEEEQKAVDFKVEVFNFNPQQQPR